MLRPSRRIFQAACTLEATHLASTGEVLRERAAACPCRFGLVMKLSRLPIPAPRPPRPRLPLVAALPPRLPPLWGLSSLLLLLEGSCWSAGPSTSSPAAGHWDAGDDLLVWFSLREVQEPHRVQGTTGLLAPAIATG